MKTLIIYYSLEGNTHAIAQHLQKQINADLLRLEVINDINPKGFMKYMRGGKQVVMKQTPELKKYNINLTDYELIIIGTPVRAFDYAPAIRSFLKDNEIDGKKLAFFCTHEGSKGKTLDNLENELFLGNKLLGSIDFVNVAKNKEAILEKASERIAGIIKI